MKLVDPGYLRKNVVVQNNCDVISTRPNDSLKRFSLVTVFLKIDINTRINLPMTIHRDERYTSIYICEK